MLFKIATSLSEVSVHNFYLILNKKDFFLLFRYPKLARLFRRHKQGLEAYKKLMAEYGEATKNKSIKRAERLQIKVLHLLERFRILNVLTSHLTESNKEKFGAEITSWGFIFNPKGSVEAQRETLDRQMRAAEGKLKIKIGEYKDLTKEDEVPKEINYLKEKVALEHATGLKIDPHTTMMDEYLEIHKFAVEMIKAQNKSKQKKHG